MKNSVIIIFIFGWFDLNMVGKEIYNVFGIKVFDISIYKVFYLENMFILDISVVWKNEFFLFLNFEVQLNEIGLYEIFLEVVDKVGEGGNIRLVR